MAKLKQALLVLATTTMVLGQRPSFAGFRPIGYPDMSVYTTTAAADDLGNRFGDGDNTTSTTTQRLPIEANGDRDLVDRLSKLPVDKQPFWFINWKAIEAHNAKPQTYPQRPNNFASVPSAAQQTSQGNIGTGIVNRNGFNSNNANNPTKSSVTRDVDVSSFMNNNNALLGVPVNGNSNAFDKKPTQVQNDGTTIRNTATANPIPVNQPQETYEDPLKVIIPGEPDYPYPILDPKTKNPSYVPVKKVPSTVDTDRIIWNRQRKQGFEERSVLPPYGFRRIEQPLYYFK